MALRLLGLAGLAIGLHQLWRRAGRRAQEASAGTEAEVRTCMACWAHSRGCASAAEGGRTAPGWCLNV